MTKTREFTAHQQSAQASLNAAKDIKKATNAVWGLAPKAGMFVKKPNPDAKPRYSKKSGKEIKVVRTNRLISSTAYLVAASGAAAAVNAQVAAEAKKLRIDMESEKTRVPWLPRYSKGAIALLEQFLCAYAQEAFYNAKEMQETLGTHEKVSKDMIRVGFERAHANVFGASAPGAARVAVVPSYMIPKPPKKGEKEKKDADPEFESN